jgi:hypothetical protein
MRAKRPSSQFQTTSAPPLEPEQLRAMLDLILARWLEPAQPLLFTREGWESLSQPYVPAVGDGNYDLP